MTLELTTTYAQNNYPIIVAHSSLNKLTEFTSSYQHTFVFVDASVYQLWKSKIDQLVTTQAMTCITIPSGEQVKYFSYYEKYLELLLSYHPTRNTCLVAIGGGATGDFVGFLAATLLRGVDFIQVPTTLLAHDSSIGGKVGINTKQGKNLVGAFHRPKAVLYDLDFLDTLPESEILSGFAEIYKHALLRNENATKALENQYPSQIELKSLKQIETYLIQGIQTKLQIVVEDEKEKGQRQFLNLGHTFGHAVEYHHRLPHGYAVMIGILYQFIVSNILFNTSFNLQHYYRYFESLGYPLEIVTSFQFEPLYALMLHDKKNDADGVRMVLLKGIGSPIAVHVNRNILHQAFMQLKQLHKEVN